MLWIMEEETASTEDKILKFLLPCWSISGCCGTHLITVVTTETKEWTCFYSKSQKSVQRHTFTKWFLAKSVKLYQEQPLMLKIPLCEIVHYHKYNMNILQ